MQIRRFTTSVMLTTIIGITALCACSSKSSGPAVSCSVGKVSKTGDPSCFCQYNVDGKGGDCTPSSITGSGVVCCADSSWLSGKSGGCGCNVLACDDGGYCQYSSDIGTADRADPPAGGSCCVTIDSCSCGSASASSCTGKAVPYCAADTFPPTCREATEKIVDSCRASYGSGGGGGGGGSGGGSCDLSKYGDKCSTDADCNAAILKCLHISSTDGNQCRAPCQNDSDCVAVGSATCYIAKAAGNDNSCTEKPTKCQ